MPTLPGMESDVYFGGVEKPLPDWRKQVRPEDGAEDATPEEFECAERLLGFSLTAGDDVPDSSPELYAWKDDEHPRGQPGNAGQFVAASDEAEKTMAPEPGSKQGSMFDEPPASP